MLNLSSKIWLRNDLSFAEVPSYFVITFFKGGNYSINTMLGNNPSRGKRMP